MNTKQQHNREAEEFLQSLQIPPASDGLTARIALAARMSQQAGMRQERSLLLFFALPRTLLACMISLFFGAMIGWNSFDYASPKPLPAYPYPQQVAFTDIWYDKGDMW